MSETPQKPLPFVYQFAAGAVAGVSEVCVAPILFVTSDCDLNR
jgi:solute carrier family 25 2-oxodicarboxylate transporter 21